MDYIGVTATSIFVRLPQSAHVGLCPKAVVNVVNVFVNTCVLGRWGRRRVAYGNMLVEDASTSPLRLPIEDMIVPCIFTPA